MQYTYKQINRTTDSYVPNFSSSEIPSLLRRASTTTSTPVTSTTTTTALIPLPTEKKRGTTVYKTEGMNIGNMQWLIDLLEEEGLNTRVTSGFREGAVTSNGHTSNHASGNALDVTAVDGENLEDWYKAVISNKRITDELKKRRYGILREDTDAALAKTGGSGYHYHIGPDQSAIKDLELGMQGQSGILARAQKGTKLPKKYNYVEIQEDTPEIDTTLIKGYAPDFQLNTTQIVEQQPAADPKAEVIPIPLKDNKPEDKPVDTKELKYRQAFAESTFRPNVKSSAGAVGLFGIMPIAEQEYIRLSGDKSGGDLSDPKYNEKIRDYLYKQWYKSADVQEEGLSDEQKHARTAAIYNRGIGNFKKAMAAAKKAGVDTTNTYDWLKYMPKETQNYVNFIVRGLDVPGTQLTAEEYTKQKGNTNFIFAKKGGIIYRINKEDQ